MLGYATLKNRWKRSRAARRRGVSLIEAVLYLSVASSVIVLMASLVNTESERQEDIAMASRMNLIISAAQRYVAAEYDTIRERLLVEARLNNDATTRVTLQDMADAGYVPQAFADEDTNIFNQQYLLLIRAVAVDDTNTPQATMTEAEIDGDGDALIDNNLIDMDNSNNEMTLEALLITTGGEDVPAHRGPPIAVRTQKPTAGFIGLDGTARGSYGSFAFDMGGFAAQPEFPGPGHFANIIALSRFSSIDLDGGSFTTNISGGVPDPMQRCSTILEQPGITPDSLVYQSCLSSNGMFNDVIFQAYDLDEDGILDTFPGLSDVNSITMSGSQDADGDGLDDTFANMTNVFGIEMADPVDTTGDGNLDTFPEITNVSRLACAAGAGTVIQGTIVLDCENVVVDGSIIVGGDNVIGGDSTADRFISTEMGGQDLSEGIYNAQLLASGDTIIQPTCPAVTADGNYQMEPRVFVVPAAYSHPGGLPTVGIRAFAEDLNNGYWQVRLYNFVDEDNCTSSVNAPLTTNTSDYRSENAAACTTADGLADVYEVSSDSGRVLAMTRCY